MANMHFKAINTLSVCLPLALLFGACSDGAVETGTNPFQEDLVPAAGKADTAYYSNLATELEGEFNAVIRLDVSTLESAAQESERARWATDTDALRQLAGQQLRLAKTQLNDAKLHLNLTADSVEIQRVDLVDGAVEIEYIITVETLVTKKELRAEGITPDDLVDAVFNVDVVADPRDLYDRIGESCASGFQPGSLNNNNLFYYFDPATPTCRVEMAPKAAFRVRSLLPQSDTFPEYDRLTEDGRVDAAVIFGAAESGAVHGGDWGVMMWRTFEVNLRLADFKKGEDIAVGTRYVRTQGGVDASIDVISPYDLEAQGGQSAQLFANLLSSNELLFYNGHSFYGSLNVLTQPEHYPVDTYQILFMNSCWSYEYYTRQVATARMSEADPAGWALVDVVNNTTYAYFVQMEQSSRVLLFNLLAGAEHGGVDDSGRRFSWQNIIGTLNRTAKGECPREDPNVDCRHYRPRSAHEMYGVSGVRDNRFQPRANSPE